MATVPAELLEEAGVRIKGAGCREMALSERRGGRSGRPYREACLDQGFCLTGV